MFRTSLQCLIHTLSPRQYLILGLVSICAPLGDTCLSRGMTHLPAITLAHPASLITAVFTPWIVAGIALLIGFFASYLTALSWADLTFVLPATALGNVIVALLVEVLAARACLTGTLGGHCAHHRRCGLCRPRSVSDRAADEAGGRSGVRGTGAMILPPPSAQPGPWTAAAMIAAVVLLSTVAKFSPPRR